MDEKTLAYVAGLFDGEGHARTTTPKAANGTRYKKLIVTVAQADRTVLDWLSEEFGFGKVYANGDKRAQENGWSTVHHYTVSYRQARKFLTALEPYLRIKKEKVTSLLDEHGREELD